MHGLCGRLHKIRLNKVFHTWKLGICIHIYGTHTNIVIIVYSNEKKEFHLCDHIKKPVVENTSHSLMPIYYIHKVTNV